MKATKEFSVADNSIEIRLVPQNEAYRTAEVEERDYEDRSLQSTIV
jgi:hypothetical protein